MITILCNKIYIEVMTRLYDEHSGTSGYRREVPLRAYKGYGVLTRLESDTRIATLDRVSRNNAISAYVLRNII